MKNRIILGLTFGSLCFSFAACTAKIYVLDRHTILEDEAAGDWPKFEKELLSKVEEQGPTALQKVPTNAEKRRLYNVLNGEQIKK